MKFCSCIIVIGANLALEPSQKYNIHQRAIFLKNWGLFLKKSRIHEKSGHVHPCFIYFLVYNGPRSNLWDLNKIIRYYKHSIKNGRVLFILSIGLH